MSTEQYPRNSKIERVPSGQIERVNIERALNFLRETCYGEMKHPESPVTEGLVKMNLEHSERVRKNAVEIARGEGLDEDILEIAAILHDLQKLDHHRRDSGGIDTWHHHHRGAALARKFLLKLNRSGELIETVVKMINRHSDIPFIRRFWEKQYGEGVPSPESREEIALRDADTLDQLGIGGIYKIVHFRQVPGSSFFKEDGGDIKKATASAHKSFLEAADVIKTKTGKEMSHKYIQQAEEFFRRLENVSNLEEFDKVYEAVMHESV